MKERQNQLAIKAWVYFCFNYWDINGIIDYICEKTGRHIEQHLKEKFMDIYEKRGSRAVMNLFYTELDLDFREALVDYAIKVYAPKGLMLSEEDKLLLGE